MTATQQIGILVVVAYFLGSIPFGLLVGLAKGVDVRKGGSGNIGATNVARLLGVRYFWLVFFLDLLKSLLPMLAAGWILYAHRAEMAVTWQVYLLWLAVGVAALVGHMFSVFLKFKGGKGVATSAGLLLGLYPYYTWPGVIGIAIFGIVFLVWRYISLASIVAAISLPVLYVIFGLAMGWDVLGAQLPLLVALVLIAALVVFKHRSNIARLRAGTESKFSGRGTAAGAAR